MEKTRQVTESGFAGEVLLHTASVQTLKCFSTQQQTKKLIYIRGVLREAFQDDSLQWWLYSCAILEKLLAPLVIQGFTMMGDL